MFFVGNTQSWQNNSHFFIINQIPWFLFENSYFLTKCAESMWYHISRLEYDFTVTFKNIGFKKNNIGCLFITNQAHWWLKFDLNCEYYNNLPCHATAKLNNKSLAYFLSHYWNMILQYIIQNKTWALTTDILVNRNTQNNQPMCTQHNYT